MFFTEYRCRYACIGVQVLLPLGAKMGLGDHGCTATQNPWGCVSQIHLSPGPGGWRWGELLCRGGDFPLTLTTLRCCFLLCFLLFLPGMICIFNHSSMQTDFYFSQVSVSQWEVGRQGIVNGVAICLNQQEGRLQEKQTNVSVTYPATVAWLLASPVVGSWFPCDLPSGPERQCGPFWKSHLKSGNGYLRDHLQVPPSESEELTGLQVRWRSGGPQYPATPIRRSLVHHTPLPPSSSPWSSSEPNSGSRN